LVRNTFETPLSLKGEEQASLTWQCSGKLRERRIVGNRSPPFASAAQRRVPISKLPASFARSPAHDG